MEGIIWEVQELTIAVALVLRLFVPVLCGFITYTTETSLGTYIYTLSTYEV